MVLLEVHGSFEYLPALLIKNRWSKKQVFHKILKTDQILRKFYNRAIVCLLYPQLGQPQHTSYREVWTPKGRERKIVWTWSLTGIYDVDIGYSFLSNILLDLNWGYHNEIAESDNHASIGIRIKIISTSCYPATIFPPFNSIKQKLGLNYDLSKSDIKLLKQNFDNSHQLRETPDKSSLHTQISTWLINSSPSCPNEEDHNYAPSENSIKTNNSTPLLTKITRKIRNLSNITNH